MTTLKDIIHVFFILSSLGFSFSSSPCEVNGDPGVFSIPFQQCFGVSAEKRSRGLDSRLHGNDGEEGPPPFAGKAKSWLEKLGDNPYCFASI